MVQLPEISQLTMNEQGNSFRDNRRVVGPATDQSGGDAMMASREGHVTTLARLDVQADDIGTFCCVQFCPYSGAEQLLATGSDQHGKLSVFRVQAGNNTGRLACDRLQDIEIGDEISCISWSPVSNCNGLVATVKLALSLFNQKEVHIVTARLKHRSLLENVEQLPTTAAGNESNEDDSSIELAELENLERQVCEQMISDIHQRTPITDIAFEPSLGYHLAGVGQDKLCCVWDMREEMRIICLFKLASAGQSVRWCPTDSDRLLVGEKSGVVRIYDLPSKTPLMSFSSLNTFGTLTCADWCRTNPFLISASIGSETIFWQSSRSSLPVDQIPSHHKGTEEMVMFNEHIYATRGRPRSQVNVHNRRTGQVLLDEQLKAGSGLSWHAKLPVLALGCYHKLVLFQLNAYT